VQKLSKNVGAPSKFSAPLRVTLSQFHTENQKISKRQNKKFSRHGNLAPDTFLPLI